MSGTGPTPNIAAPAGTRQRAGRYPALDTWRCELARGERTTCTRDALWGAACWESSAAELERDGLQETARHCRRESARILRTASRGAA